MKESEAIHKRVKIETDVRKEEGQHPNIVRALDELAAARVEMDRELHRVVPSLPPHQGQPTAADYLHEMRLLSGADEQRLKDDVRYQDAKRKAYSAYTDLERSRLAVYKTRPDWVEADALEAAARRRRIEAEKQIVLANAGTLGAAWDAHGSERIAKEARVMIARGRAMIRELGGVPPPPPKPKPKPKSKPKPKPKPKY